MRKLCLLLAVIAAPLMSYGEVAVVANPKVGATSVSIADTENIFLGKLNQLSDGSRVKPVVQEEGQPARTEFNDLVLKKSDSQLNAYWSRLVFTGKGEQPKAYFSDEDVIRAVANNPELIGYVNASSADDRVKVLLTLP